MCQVAALHPRTQALLLCTGWCFQAVLCDFICKPFLLPFLLHFALKIHLKIHLKIQHHVGS